MKDAAKQLHTHSSSTDLYSPLADFFVSGVFLLGIADAHDGSLTQRKTAHVKEVAGLINLHCCSLKSSFTQFIHDFLIRHLALLFLPVCSLGSHVTIHAGVRGRDGIDHRAGIHLRTRACVNETRKTCFTSARRSTYALRVLGPRCHHRRRRFVVVLVVDVFDIRRGGFGAFLDGLVGKEILLETEGKNTRVCV